MVNTPLSNTMTKIRVALLDDDGEPRGGETLWAEPVAGRPKHYALRNNGFNASLRLHDVVRTELDGCGLPQVVAFEALHTGPVTITQLPAGTGAAEVARTADSWTNLGSEYSENGGGVIVTAWVSGATPQSVCEVVAATAPGWRLLDVATAPIRAARLRREVDLRLDRRTLEDIDREQDLGEAHGALCGCEECDPVV